MDADGDDDVRRGDDDILWGGGVVLVVRRKGRARGGRATVVGPPSLGLLARARGPRVSSSFFSLWRGRDREREVSVDGLSAQNVLSCQEERGVYFALATGLHLPYRELLISY